MQITSKTEYAMRALLYLARQDSQVYHLTKDVAENESIPLKFLAQIVRDLGRANIIDASRGPHGGIRLAKSPAKVRAFDIVEAIEGNLALFGCVGRPEYCERQKGCPICGLWAEAQSEMVKVFKRTTLAELSAAESKDPHEHYQLKKGARNE